MLKQALLSLLEGLEARDPADTTDSWLHYDRAGLRRAAVEELKRDEIVANLWQPGAMLRFAGTGGCGYDPELFLAGLGREAEDIDDPADRRRLVDEFIRFVRVEEERVTVRVKATLLGPALAHVDQAQLSSGTLARVTPSDLLDPKAADATDGITYTFLCDVPAIVATDNARPAPSTEIDNDVLRLLVALTLVGDSPVQEHLTMVSPRFASTAAGEPLRPAGPVVVPGISHPLTAALIFGDLDSWMRRLQSVDVAPLGVAVRRVLRARTERVHPTDQLIDFAVALEALTGLSSVNRRGGLIRRLLDSDAESAHRRISDARNAILHEGREPRAPERLVADGVGLLGRLLVTAVGAGGRLTDPAATEAIDDLEPPVHPAPVPPAVVANRRLYDAWREEIAEERGAATQAHLMVLGALLNTIVEDHAGIADRFDIDLAADTRWAAAWIMAGRSLSLGVALLALLRVGNLAGAAPVARTMHEANRLLDAFVDQEETALLRRWLADERITPGETRAAVGRAIERELERIRETGIEIEPEGDPTQLSTEIYRILSKPAHNQRSGVMEQVSPDLRRFMYHAAPDAQSLAASIAVYETMLIDTASAVGDLLSRWHDGPYYTWRVKPLLDHLVEVGQAFPLDRPAI